MLGCTVLCSLISMSLDVRYVFDWSLPPAVVPVLLRWLVAAGADEFTVAVMALVDVPAPVADAFEDALAPFELPPARRRVLLDADAPDRAREVRRWQLSPASVAVLLPFFRQGLFHAAPSTVGPDGWLEDLTVYREGELVLGIVSHEQTGVLRLTADEHEAVTALGVRSEATAEWISY